MSPFALSLAVLIEPTRAFSILRARPTFWFPLLLIMAGHALVLTWYYSVVDVAWLIEQISQRAPGIPKQTNAPVNPIISRDILMTASLVSVVIGMPLINFAQALYFSLIGKLLNVKASLKTWLAITCWSALPSALVAPLMAIQIARMDQGQLIQESLDITSLNFMFFRLAPIDRLASLLSSINIAMLWTIGLLVIALQVVAYPISWVKAILIVLLPYMLIYCVWALMALSGSPG